MILDLFKLNSTMLFVVLSLATNAQVWTLQAYQYAWKNNTIYGWTDWSNWVNTSVTILINSDYINIYSATPQSYRILQLLNIDYTNNIYKWQCVDYRNIYCTIRFKIDDNQLYIDYNDAMWVYNFRM